MNFTKATDQQIKTIIEGDVGLPTSLLKEVYEEAMRRKVFHNKLAYFILGFFKSKLNAEQKTGLTIEELIWICYEIGYEFIDQYKPTQPFAALWHKVMMRKVKDIARDNNAQKRQGEVYSLEEVNAGAISGGNYVEPMALNRVLIDSIMNQLTDTEKEIVIKRYQGYCLREIAEMQGVTKTGVQLRIKAYQKRLKGA